MTPSHILEMINKENIDSGTTSGPDEGHSLSGSFLCHGSAEAIRDLCDESCYSRCALPGPTPDRKVSCCVGYCRGKRSPNRKISHLAAIIRNGWAAQGEDFNACELCTH